MDISRFSSRLFLLAALCIGAAATAQQRGEILALGDSVAFGYIASVGDDNFFYTRSENFVGFPNDLANRLHFELVNASCPGETTGSFLSSTAPDNGCRKYRKSYPLHTGYGSTQLDFAKRYLGSHRDVRIVTLTVGANDGLLLEKSCEIPKPPATVDSCILDGAPAMLAGVATNIATILAELRGTGYGGAIVLTNYYSTDYSRHGELITELTADLDAAIAAPATAYGAVVADLFTVFQSVASDPTFGGRTCMTGLLNPDVHTETLCNIHPARTGHFLIAKTIEEVLRPEDSY